MLKRKNGNFFSFDKMRDSFAPIFYLFFLFFNFCFRMTQKFRDQLNLGIGTFSQLLSVAKNYSEGQGVQFFNCFLLYLKNCQAKCLKIFTKLRSYLLLNHAKIKLGLFGLMTKKGDFLEKGANLCNFQRSISFLSFKIDLY